MQQGLRVEDDAFRRGFKDLTSVYPWTGVKSGLDREVWYSACGQGCIALTFSASQHQEQSMHGLMRVSLVMSRRSLFF